MLTDILHAFAQNPTNPAYDPALAMAARLAARATAATCCSRASTPSATTDRAFRSTTSGRRIRCCSSRCASRRALVTNGEWLEFMADGGYSTPSLWLSDGWATCRRRLVRAGLLAA